MPDWAHSGGAFVLYGAILGAILAIAGGLGASWLEERWSRKDAGRALRLSLLLDMLDMLAEMRTALLNVFLPEYRDELPELQVSEMQRRFATNMTQLYARALMTEDHAVVEAMSDLERSVIGYLKSESDDDAELPAVRIAFDDAIATMIDAVRRLT